MHILIPIFFNAPLGGLHENVLSTALYCKMNNFKVTVLCKSGAFQEKLEKLGVKVITTDYSDHDLPETIRKVNDLNKKEKIDLIHTHPFASRKYAQHIARLLKIPLFLTVHGKHTNNIESYIDEIDLVFTVSEGIKDFLLEHLTNKHAEDFKHKFFVIPNGVNTNKFRATVQKDEDDKTQRNQTDTLTLSLVSRLDLDKQFIIDIFYKALSFTSKNYPNINWRIVGEGTQKNIMKDKVKEITFGKTLVNFVGWKEGDELKKEYQTSDIVIAPGRCALEAMACGKPVIALGSKGYIGLINENNWLKGVYSNFGGLGSKMEDYQNGSVEDDLKTVIEGSDNRLALGNLSLKLIEQFYNENKINERLIGFYKMHKHFRKTETNLPPEALEAYLLKTNLINFDCSQVDKNAYKFTINCISIEGLQFAWYIYKDNKLYKKISYSEDNTLQFTFTESGKYRLKYYVKKPETSTIISFNSYYLNIN